MNLLNQIYLFLIISWEYERARHAHKAKYNKNGSTKLLEDDPSI